MRGIAGRHRNGFGEAALALPGFGRQDMTGERVPSHDLTASRQLEALGRATMSLELRLYFRFDQILTSSGFSRRDGLGCLGMRHRNCMTGGRL